MKKSIIGIMMLTFLFWGCQKETTTTVPPENETETGTTPSTELEDVVSTSANTVGLGEDCGKALNTFCEDGLECQIRVNRPNQTGKCINPIVEKNLTCSDEVEGAPVCGLKNNVKRGYMNECEARRHGAEVIHERFCFKDETAEGSCQAEVLSIGGKGCEDVFTGYYYDETQEECVERKIAGCDAEIPFETLEACEDKCPEETVEKQ